jgi:galactonate dehydratase
MKIASVECLPVYSGWRKNFVFVRIETDAGVVGWGEAYSQYDRDRAIAAQVEGLGRYLVGRDPFHIRHILQIAQSLIELLLDKPDDRCGFVRSNPPWKDTN